MPGLAMIFGCKEGGGEGGYHLLSSNVYNSQNCFIALFYKLFFTKEKLDLLERIRQRLQKNPLNHTNNYVHQCFSLFSK